MKNFAILLNIAVLGTSLFADEADKFGKAAYFKNLFKNEMASTSVQKEQQSALDKERQEVIDALLVDTQTRNDAVTQLCRGAIVLDFTNQEEQIINAANDVKKEFSDAGFWYYMNQELVDDTVEDILNTQEKAFQNLALKEGQKDLLAQREFIVQQFKKRFECGYYGHSKGCQGIGQFRYWLGKAAAEGYYGQWDSFEPVEHESAE